MAIKSGMLMNSGKTTGTGANRSNTKLQQTPKYKTQEEVFENFKVWGEMVYVAAKTEAPMMFITASIEEDKKDIIPFDSLELKWNPIDFDYCTIQNKGILAAKQDVIDVVKAFGTDMESYFKVVEETLTDAFIEVVGGKDAVFDLFGKLSADVLDRENKVKVGTSNLQDKLRGKFGLKGEVTKTTATTNTTTTAPKTVQEEEKPTRRKLRGFSGIEL